MIDATSPGTRRALILKRIQQEGLVSLADLASEHEVSAVTVHRDLNLLSEEGLLERVRGGARPPVADGVVQAHPAGVLAEGLADRRRRQVGQDRQGGAVDGEGLAQPHPDTGAARAADAVLAQRPRGLRTRG